MSEDREMICKIASLIQRGRDMSASSEQIAHVVIEGMHEPTEAMLAAVDCAGQKRDWLSGHSWVVGYKSMIRAALK